MREEATTILTELDQYLKGRVQVRITSTLRTFAEQTALYNLGRTVKNPDGITKSKPLGQIVTNAKAGQSNHNFGLSLDFALLRDKNGDGKFESMSWDTEADYDLDGVKDWIEVVNIFKKHGWEWGGNWKSFKDMPHVQKTFGLNVTQCHLKYLNHEFIPGTTYIKI